MGSNQLLSFLPHSFSYITIVSAVTDFFLWTSLLAIFFYTQQIHASVSLVYQYYMLASQGLVLATAMAVSAGTVLLFDLFWEKHFSASLIPWRSPDSLAGGGPVLKSCLSSGRKRRVRRGGKKVRFADDVKDSIKEGKKKEGGIRMVSCGNEILGLQGMPANRAALYSGILRDRVQRMESSC